jgi:hypothetical protein
VETATRALAWLAGPAPSPGARRTRSPGTRRVLVLSTRSKCKERSSGWKALRQQLVQTPFREEELADGHADCRFSGYVTISAPDLEALEDASGEVEQLAQQCRLQLTRLRGQQAEAFTWTLPLARGLR